MSSIYFLMRAIAERASEASVESGSSAMTFSYNLMAASLSFPSAAARVARPRYQQSKWYLAQSRLSSVARSAVNTSAACAEARA